jgi:hypothetical protein
MMAVSGIRNSADSEATDKLERRALLPYMQLIKEKCPRSYLLEPIIDRATVYVCDADRFFNE